VRAGLTTSQTTHEARLTELLSSLESVVDNLNFKSFTVYDTLNTAIEDLRAALLPTTEVEGGTDE
jgi:glutathionyl-hydroquinone reductase